jgi:hypothetical protein
MDNFSDWMEETVMIERIERIRLVNPVRPGVLQAKIRARYGFLVARTENCRNFSIPTSMPILIPAGMVMRSPFAKDA